MSNKDPEKFPLDIIKQQFLNELATDDKTTLGILPLNAIRNAAKILKNLTGISTYKIDALDSEGTCVGHIEFDMQNTKATLIENKLLLQLHINRLDIVFFNGFTSKVRFVKDLYIKLDRDLDEALAEIDKVIGIYFKTPKKMLGGFLPVFNLFEAMLSERPIDCRERNLEMIDHALELAKNLKLDFKYDTISHDFFFEVRNRFNPRTNPKIDNRLVSFLIELHKRLPFFYFDGEAIVLAYDGNIFVIDKQEDGQYFVHDRSHPSVDRWRLAMELAGDGDKIKYFFRDLN